MKRSSILIAILLLSQPNLHAADWPTYLNDNGRVGATSEQLETPLNLAWTYSAPAPPELAFPGPRAEPIEGKLMRHRMAFDRVLDVVSVGDWAYFGSSVDHKVYCVNAKTGEPRWEFFTDGPVRLAPTVWEGKVYVGSDDGLVYCLDAENGSVVWKTRVGPADERLLGRGRMISRWPVRTSVLIDDGIAYFGAGVFPHETVYLCAANAKTGKILWKNDRISQKDAGRNDLTPQGYLLASDNQLFIPSGRSLPTAFSRESGDQIYKKSYSWRSTAGGVVGGTKAILADGQIYASGPHHFLAMNQESGAVGFAWITGRQLTLSGDKGFVATGKEIVAMDRLKHAKATIERQKFNLQRNDLLRKRRSMKADEYNRQLKELDTKIAELSQVGVLWSTPSDCDAALIVAGDLVFAGGPDRVIALKVETGEEIWSGNVKGVASGLAAAGGCLFASTDQGKIYGFADSHTAQPTEVANYPAESRMDNPYEDSKLTTMYEAAAKQIIERSGIKRGFCLVVGSEQGQLAYELAKRTDLRIYGIEPDEAKVAESRRKLDAAGLHGHRITIVHGDPAKMPFSNYFANLVVSDTLLLTGKVPGDEAEIARCVKPCGGVACLVVPDSAAGAEQAKKSNTFHRIVVAMDGETESVRLSVKSKTDKTLTRGKLTGAGDWSHQYGDVANTSSSQDYRVKGGMSVLWYGDPGAAPMVNRHEAAAAPLSTNGRMFIQGTDSILCYDAYNGLFLWEYKNPGAIRTGVFNNEETSNLAASDDEFFVVVDDTCTVIDAATGKVIAEHNVPPSEDKIKRTWGFVGYYDGLLFGTSTIRKELAASLRRRGHTVANETDAIFAVDVKSGKRLWEYRGKNIMHMTIAIGDDHVFFIDSSITQEQRDALLHQDKEELKKLGPKEAKTKEVELKKLDVRTAVAVNARTGDIVWLKPVDVTNASYVGIGGGQLTLMYQDGHVIICGANANGHYWRQFLSGQFKERRIVVLEAGSGKKLWDKDANYRHRPIVVKNEVIAEPWSFDLESGEEKKRVNPLTGELTKWQFSRPGHHCGMITATPNTLFFRSGFTGYYDLYSDSGTSHFAGHRTGCWINVIPANGLVVVPEASAGCVCQFSIASTVVMEPREDRDTWRIYSATGPKTPIKRLGLNLGAPGDRRDSAGNLWLAYPRPKTVGRLEYVFDMQTKFVTGGGYYDYNSESMKIEGAEDSWVYTTGANGISRCEIPLLGEGDEAGVYTVTLHFAETEDIGLGDRVFDVKIQDAVVAEGIDLIKDTGGTKRKLVKSISGVDVTGGLVIELVPQGKLPPSLAAIQIQRE